MNKKYYIITESGKKVRLKDWIKNNFLNVPFGLSENYDEDVNASFLINSGWTYSESYEEVIILPPEAEEILRNIAYGNFSPEDLINFNYWNRLVKFFNF